MFYDQWRGISRRVVLQWAVFIVLALLVGSAFAQEMPPTNGGPTPPASGQKMGFIDSIAQSVVGMVTYLINSVIGSSFVQTVKAAALSMSSSTQGFALGLAGGLALATLLWKILMDMLSKKSVAGSAVEVIIFSMITATMITNYTEVVELIWDIASGLLSSFSPGGVGEALARYVLSFFSAFASVIKTIFSAWSKLDGFSFTLALLDMLFTMFLVIAVFYMMMTSLASIIGVFVMGPVYFAIGIVFGPVMIATLVSDYTRGWFKKWFEFLVGSAMLTTVAALVLVLITRIIEAAISNIEQAGVSGVTTLMGIAILSMSFTKLFESVPSITDALFPGRTGASGSINNKMSAATIAAAATGIAGLKGASAVAKAAPGALAGAASATAGAVIATLNAKTHMTNGLEKVAGSVSSVASESGKALSNFASQVKQSDAGRAISKIAGEAAQHSERSVQAGFPDKTVAGSFAQGSPESGAGLSANPNTAIHENNKPSSNGSSSRSPNSTSGSNKQDWRD